MHRNILIQQIKQKKTYLCVGLDTDIDKIPKHLLQNKNAIVDFNKAIIDATKNYCVSYKINTAFYEALGSKGWAAMEETVDYIPSTHLKIADAKRGDIGNTSSQYAKAFFETLKFDAITIAPYMGEDSIRPFLEYEDKWTIVLGLTSNKGAADFEMKRLVGEVTNKGDGQLRSEYLYENVIKKIALWGSPNNLMFVIGATQANELENIRTIIPHNFLLIPGVGFQGGSLAETSKHGMNKDCGLLVNASRAIIYAGSGENFAAEAAEIAKQYQTEMSNFLANI
ncbi:MAG: orotidine-5'-phosphate decarboxylase [Ferruginibacter sp.]|nr:orotidine-5'-phosphate decarboxylase [Ferruginibacter sp.]